MVVVGGGGRRLLYSSILSCARLHVGLSSIVRFSPRLCHRINSKAFQKRAQPNIPVAQRQMSCHILSSWHLGSFGPRGFQNIPLQ